MKFYDIQINIHDEATNEKINSFTQCLPGNDPHDALGKAEQVCNELDEGYYGVVVTTVDDLILNRSQT